MKLSELLLLIESIAKRSDLSTPFICGGLARDKALGRSIAFHDIDLTTGDPDIHFLAKEVGIALGNIGAKYLLLDDGHSRVMLGELKLDFSSNFIIPGVEKIVGKELSQLQQEVYSRDFTCNTLLMTMDLKKIIDPTGKAVPDMGQKILKTCLAPTYTLGVDPKRIIRAIYLASKLNFTLDAELVKFIQENGKLLTGLDTKYIVKTLLKSYKSNKQTTLKLIEELNISKYLPLTLELS